MIKMDLIGLIREDEDGNVVIRNRIYEQMLAYEQVFEFIQSKDEESLADKQTERSSLTAEIISDYRMHIPLIAISRIEPKSRTINRIKKEVDKSIPIFTQDRQYIEKWVYVRED